MPYINIKTNVEIAKKQEESIKTKLGKAISLIPGKSESWLMLSFDDGCRMYFKGENKLPMAFVEIKLFGKAADNDYNKLTGAVTEILGDELEIASDRIYVKYEETMHWGFGGKNF
ncbi:MAG: phenylpyruvate tautomerase MIF-related protein [Clostridia bacterium]|nr:phenylpyruvate tautomerase MIF-related protein [Clostridia bacterium]